MDTTTLHALALNESPYPPLPSVQAAMARAVAQANRYPDLFPDRLAAHIADRWSVAPRCVAVGSGSVGVALQLLRAVVRPGDRVAYGWRTFDGYPLLAQMVGAQSLAVPLLPDGRQDLAALAAVAGSRTRVLVICNPHNPTGSAVLADELAALLHRVPVDVTVVLDEAYAEFARHPHLADGPAVLGLHPNLVVLRTFSKAYGLAALRVGYALGSPDLMDRVRRQQLPFGINAVATAAVEASLEAGDELRRRVDAVVAERDRLGRELRAAGWRIPPSDANCLWLAEPDRADAGAAALAAAGVQVRAYAGEGIRVTVGSRDANDAVLATLASLT
ncbi:histidinol-phosphate transaminase [Actinoplanes sp. NPDC049681]|uniref:histidinol-phosphate transaminase n=1 Tax=Actinoplanes sp. NPDC049681 TaxID=3363905 RepID=UPI00378A45C3